MTTTILSFNDMVEVLRPEKNEISFLKMQALALQKDLAMSEELIAAQNKIIAKNVAMMTLLASGLRSDDLQDVIRKCDEIINND